MLSGCMVATSFPGSSLFFPCSSNIAERLLPEGLRAGNFRGEEDVKGFGNRDGNRV